MQGSNHQRIKMRMEAFGLDVYAFLFVVLVFFYSYTYRHSVPRERNLAILTPSQKNFKKIYTQKYGDKREKKFFLTPL